MAGQRDKPLQRTSKSAYSVFSDQGNRCQQSEPTYSLLKSCSQSSWQPPINIMIVRHALRLALHGKPFMQLYPKLTNNAKGLYHTTFILT